MHNLRYKTIHWKFLESIEPPKVVHARCTDVVSKENVFGQITCRFFTKQVTLKLKLAITIKVVCVLKFDTQFSFRF